MKTRHLTPAEAVEAWNRALEKGDGDTARRLTSNTSGEYVREAFGSLEKLSKRYQTELKGLKTTTRVIEEEIDGESAVVVYRVVYDAGRVTYWMDRLLREDGEWKVAPQFTSDTPLRGNA